MRTLLAILFMGALAAASPSWGNAERKRQELLSIIDEELVEIGRLNKQVGSSNPKLLVRLAELYLEKARILKELENSKFLSVSPEIRRNADKNSFFRESNSYFVRAQKTCYFVLKRFKKLEFRPDIFYILAYNAKEFNQLDRSKKYFTEAYKTSKPGTTIHNKAKLALADIYYNDKQYAKAASFYEGPLKDKSSRWWTKDAYNLAWCYYRTKRTSLAIEVMRDVHATSKDGVHVDMSPEAERDLALFYSEVGKVDEAVDFYKKVGSDATRNAVKVGKYLLGQGKYAAAEKMLTEAKGQELSPEEELDVDLSLVALYERFGKTELHLQTCKRLLEAHKQGRLDQDQLEVLVYQVRTASANLQRQVTEKTYRGVPTVNRQKMAHAAEYFRILSELAPQSSYKFLLLAAETFYAGGSSNQALEFYNRSFEGAEKAGDKEFQAKAVEGMMASLGKDGVTKETKDKYLARTYTSYLKINPNGPKSAKVAQRLFGLEFDKGNLEGAEKVAVFYKNNFPEDKGALEAMIAKIMDYHKNRKDKAALTAWAKRIQAGEFEVSEKYAKTLGTLMFTMQFEGIEQAASKGDKARALKGYAYIYKDKESTPEAKKNAAYNVAVFYHELGRPDKGHSWALRAVEMMTPSDVEKYQGTFLLMGSELFGRRMADRAISLNEAVLGKLCQSKSAQKNPFFKNNLVIFLAEGWPDKAAKWIKRGEQCGVAPRHLTEARVEIAEYYAEEKSWSELAEWLKVAEKDKDAWPELIRPSFALYNAYEKNAQKGQAEDASQKIMSYYAHGKSSKKAIPLEALDVVAHFKIRRLNGELKKLSDIRLRFPEKDYNEALKAKFKQLDVITTQGLEVLSVGSGVGIVRTYKYFVECYQSVIDEVRTFTPPEKPPEYVASFKQSMEALVKPLQNKVAEFRAEARKQIQADQILSKDNAYFTGRDNVPVVIEYSWPKGAVIMDRGGR